MSDTKAVAPSPFSVFLGGVAAEMWLSGRSLPAIDAKLQRMALANRRFIPKGLTWES